jgi:four helix bundle protein
MQDFRNLQVWQKAHKLVLLIYRLTADFPKDELFGLRTQLRKTSIDIAGYVAEGSGKPNDEDFARCVGIALGFANRLEYFALVASDLRFLPNDEYEQLNGRIVDVSKMLSSLWQKLKKKWTRFYQ